MLDRLKSSARVARHRRDGARLGQLLGRQQRQRLRHLASDADQQVRSDLQQHPRAVRLGRRRAVQRVQERLQRPRRHPQSCLNPFASYLICLAGATSVTVTCGASRRLRARHAAGLRRRPPGDVELQRVARARRRMHRGAWERVVRPARRRRRARTRSSASARRAAARRRRRTRWASASTAARRDPGPFALSRSARRPLRLHPSTTSPGRRRGRRGPSARRRSRRPARRPPGRRARRRRARSCAVRGGVESAVSRGGRPGVRGEQPAFFGRRVGFALGRGVEPGVAAQLAGSDVCGISKKTPPTHPNAWAVQGSPLSVQVTSALSPQSRAAELPPQHGIGARRWPSAPAGCCRRRRQPEPRQEG